MNKLILLLFVLINFSASAIHQVQDWVMTEKWHRLSDKTYVMKATSFDVVAKCKTNPNGFLSFPTLVQGAHKIFLDGKEILQFGDTNFKIVKSYYGAPYLKCQDLIEGTKLEWEAHVFVEEFEKFDHFPYILNQKPFTNVISETIGVMSVGALVMLAFFCFIVFRKKVSNVKVFSLVCANLFSAVYFMITCADFFNINISMLLAHKLSDSSLMIGIILFLNVLRIEKLLNAKMFYALILFVIAGIGMIISGHNGDEIQTGTSFPFIALTLSMLLCLITLVRKAKFDLLKKNYFYHFVSLLVYVSTSINDMMVVSNIYSGYFLYPIGILGGLLFLALSVNEKIMKTYVERDYLRSHLEQEVQKQTEEIRDKSVLLEKTLNDLKAREADLIQAEKLASLGTLSAGIAHEINNSLNYVNGSLTPLQKLITKNTELLDNDKNKMNSLITIMKEGLALTLHIIKSLRNYTGLNQAAWKEVNVLEMIDSVLLMLKSKIGLEIKVVKELDPQLHFYCNVVGLNQILTNLICNAVDAMKGQGEIIIKVVKEKDKMIFSIADSGEGISPAIKSKIFDPFFTTKEVGKGTGLGLHIVKSEVEKHSGSVEVSNANPHGTIFTLIFSTNLSIQNGPADLSDWQKKVS